MTAEYKTLTCAICGKPIDPNTFYASYDSQRKAHMSCWNIAAAVRHSIPTQPSRFTLVR
jgi:hypothetical protein